MTGQTLWVNGGVYAMNGAGKLLDRVILITGGVRGLAAKWHCPRHVKGPRYVSLSAASGIFDQTVDDITAIAGTENLIASVSDVTRKRIH